MSFVNWTEDPDWNWTAKVFGKKPQPKPQPEPEPHYFEMPDLLPAERALIIDALERHPNVTVLRKGLLAKLELAKRVDLPLPAEQVRLDWDALEAEARVRGTTWDEAWYDLIAKHRA